MATASGPFINEEPDANSEKASEADSIKHVFPHPLTPNGISAYANVSFAYTAYTILVFAIICSVSICWMFSRCLIVPLNLGVERLPEKGGISNGRLQWFTNETTVLIETRTLSIHVNPTDEEPIADGADLQIVFEKDRLLLRSLFGWLPIPYPKTLNFPLNLKDLWTSWGAYKNAIIPLVFIFSACFLVVVWGGLAWIYSIPIALLVKIIKAKTSSAGIFRISLMSQMLSALIMSAGVIFYTLARIDLTTLCIIFAIHIPFAWIYLLITPFYLPKIPDNTSNPFNQNQ
ncbi:MAG: hypothetical protein N2487_05430 [Verrucomicrobiae bacterium]|nr:hypothetical protein [Verrucomicrobiae bacterium]